MKMLSTLLAASIIGRVAMPALAQDKNKQGNNECPVGLVSGLRMDDEFGPGTQAPTQCIKKHHNVKMVVRINPFCTHAATPCGLGNIRNILDDYEVAPGVKPGREMAVVLHSPGGRMALKATPVRGDGTAVAGCNPFEATIRGPKGRGVKFYFCQTPPRA